jgi:hypothetical protein
MGKLTITRAADIMKFVEIYKAQSSKRIWHKHEGKHEKRKHNGNNS